MSLTVDKPTADEPERYVYVELARCPRCHSARLKAYKTLRPEPEVLNRYTLCRDCGHKFIVVAE
jgi:C4-type Zn-finger protein